MWVDHESLYYMEWYQIHTACRHLEQNASWELCYGLEAWATDTVGQPAHYNATEPI